MGLPAGRTNNKNGRPRLMGAARRVSASVDETVYIEVVRRAKLKKKKISEEIRNIIIDSI